VVAGKRERVSECAIGSVECSDWTLNSNWEEADANIFPSGLCRERVKE